MPPKIELLWWSGCPSNGTAKAMLEQILAEAGLDPALIETLQIVTDEEAAREQFIGSPTIRINGSDIVAVQNPRPALTCRLYLRRDGHSSPLPDLADIRDALRHALDQA